MIHPENPARSRYLGRARAAVLGTVLALVSIAAPHGHGASAAPLDMAGGCAVAQASARETTGHLDADKLVVSLPAQPGAAFHAAHLSAAIQKGSLPSGALGAASTAAAAALLVAVGGHHQGACSDDAFQQAAAPLAKAIAAGARATFTWTDVSISSGSKRVGAAKLSLRLSGEKPKARLILVLTGAVSNDPAAALLPETLNVTASLPASELPGLLAATGGQGAPVDLSIEHLDAKRGATSLSGTGQARIAAQQAENAGTAHVTVSGYDALVSAAGAAGLQKLRTGLFLAKLMAHQNGESADWDLVWQGATLLVNNVPLPLH